MENQKPKIVAIILARGGLKRMLKKYSTFGLAEKCIEKLKETNQYEL